jgi:exonuclease SbcD
MALRLLHTSDWHLGRALHGESLLADQAWILERLFEAVRDARPDVLVVAGDLYDRGVPPPEAVTLLDDVLTRAASIGLPIVAIAGNHDSPERLCFGSRLLEGRGVHLRGALDGCARPVEIPGKGLLYPVPFLDPEVVRGHEQDDDIRGHAAATARVLARARSDAAARGLPTVLVAHAFAQGAAESPDSERPLAVGGSGAVPVSTFEGFDYVALGHLHARQEVGAGVHYSGSPLKYSFGEAAHQKAVVLVEVEKGRARTEAIPLGARRDVVRLRGTMSELLTRPDLDRHRPDLLEITLTDDGYVFDAKHRLEARFAHVLNVVRDDLCAGGVGTFTERVEGAGRDDAQLFRAFFEAVAGGPPAGEQQAAFAAALAAVERAELRA